MNKLFLKLADIPIEFRVEYDFIEKHSKAFLTDEEPLFSVCAEKEHIELIRQQLRERDVELGNEIYDFGNDYLEFLALNYASLQKLLEYNVVMFHGSAVAVDGKAYIFTGKSGIGKTTHSKLWIKNFKDCHILNGDKPLLLFKDGKVFCCGSPWNRKELDTGENEILPLEAICLLEQTPENRIEEIEFRSAFNTLVNQCHIPKENNGLISVINLVRELAQVRLYKLGCNMDDDAAFVSYNKMIKDE